MSDPYLEEHRAPSGKNTTKEGYNPTPEEKEAIKLVESLYAKAKKHRRNYDGQWIEDYKMFRGKQWSEMRPSYRHSEVLNIVFQTIQSMVPTLTDSRPKIEFIPQTPEMYELAQILSKVVDNDWEQNDWMNVLLEVIYDAHFYGTGIGYMGYDDDANLGLGNACFESSDPIYFFPSPEARDVNEKRSKALVVVEPVDVAVLKAEYKDKARFIVPDVLDLNTGSREEINSVLFRSPNDGRLLIEGSGNFDSAGKNQTLKITLYMKPDDIEEIEKEALNENGEPVLDEYGAPTSLTEQRLKYPKGRKICIASGVLLHDGPIEFDDVQFPYAKLTNYMLPREFWGISEVEPIKGPQKTINKLLSFALDVMTLMGNPVWIVGPTANIDTDNLTNQPGLIVETDDMNAVRRTEGVQLQPFVMGLLDRYKTYIDGVSGQTDISRGVESSQVTSASGINLLQEAQKTRLRLKSRNIDTFLKQIGRLYLSRVFQFYNLPRIVRVSGTEGAEKYFHFHVEDVQDEEGNVKKVANVTQTNDFGLAETKKYEILGDFDVRVTTGSSLPFAKEQKAGLAMNLFKLGLIDDEALLKDVDYPNYQQVLARVNEKKAKMAAAQAQQQGMPPQGAPQV